MSNSTDREPKQKGQPKTNHQIVNSSGSASQLIQERTSQSSVNRALRDAESRLFFIFPELRASLKQSAITSSSTMEPQAGVLWKRRDFFKNRWRPRWFTLNPSQGVLTYYLLTSPPPPPDPAEAATPPRGSAARNRATSWDSQLSNVSENTRDYDVVPRGTIYLLGCSVAIDEKLSRSDEKLYAFTIRPPDSSETSIYLATRTPEMRALWVEKITRVCRAGFSPPRANGTLSPRSLPRGQIPLHLQTSSSQRLLQREHSIPEESSQDFVGEDLSEVEESDTDDSQQSWKSLGANATLYADVPKSLALQIQEKLKTYLPLCEDNGDSWKRLFHHKNGHAAYQRTDGNGRSIVKSVAVLDHPPKQVFDLLIDISRRQDFETNVRSDDRLQTLNPHTFLDYYAYNAVWPTSAREFTVVTHWEVVGKRDKRAIAMISFSCTEADALKAPEKKHVRATLFVSMYLLRPVYNREDEQCHFTRLLSFDLGGGMNQHLSNVVSTQQASLPAVIADYLQHNEPVVENRHRGLLSNEEIVENVIYRLSRVSNGSPAAKRPYLAAKSMVVNDDSDISSASDEKASTDTVPPVESQAVVLMAPVILHRIVLYCGIPGASAVFVVAAFLAVRQVVLWYLGKSIPPKEECITVGPVTCRFTVDCKGILRFIANKREEREEMNTCSAEVTVVHIIIKAVALALKTEPELQWRRVRLPWLFIDRLVDASTAPIDVSVSEDSGAFVTLRNVDVLSTQSIADDLAAAEGRTCKKKEVGQCLVLAIPSSDDSEVETDAAPIHPDISVVVVVGGLRQERKERRPSAPKCSAAQHPVLSLSLTVTGGHHQADIIACRRFADEMRKLLEFPELCE